MEFQILKFGRRSEGLHRLLLADACLNKSKNFASSGNNFILFISFFCVENIDVKLLFYVQIKTISDAQNVAFYVNINILF